MPSGAKEGATEVVTQVTCSWVVRLLGLALIIATVILSSINMSFLASNSRSAKTCFNTNRRSEYHAISHDLTDSVNTPNLEGYTTHQLMSTMRILAANYYDPECRNAPNAVYDALKQTVFRRMCIANELPKSTVPLADVYSGSFGTTGNNGASTFLTKSNVLSSLAQAANKKECGHLISMGSLYSGTYQRVGLVSTNDGNAIAKEEVVRSLSTDALLRTCNQCNNPTETVQKYPVVDDFNFDRTH